VRDGPLVIVLATDIEPDAVEVVRTDFLPRGQQRLNEVGEVEVRGLRDELDRAGLEDVDTHADRRSYLGLLLERLDLPGVAVRAGVEDAVIDLHDPAARRDRQHVPRLPVVPEQVAVIERREDVAVHHDEGVVEPVGQA